MKFGDKLIELRKKNNYSQEDLAEKLGVSRQSVSKWESNNTYPETDKIIQIANLFDCSMDDLINDKVTDIESSLRKNKNNFYTVWDSFLEFIINTINMFSKMKFIDGLKCIIEIIILCFILVIVGNIICGITSSTIANIFRFLNRDVLTIIKETLNGIFHLIWFIVAIIIIIHTFKIRYLNYYIENNKENKSINKKLDKDSNKEESLKNEKIILRDEKPFEFLGVLSKIVIIVIKFIVFWLLLGVVFVTVSLVIITVISMAYITTNIIFLWIFLLSLAISVVSIQIIILLINFIFNKKINLLLHVIIFISCIVLSGISIAMITMSVKNFELIDDNSVFNIKEKEITIDYKDNLVIESAGVGDNSKYRYIIDENIENNKIMVSRKIDSKYFRLYTEKSSMDNLPVIIVNEENRNDIKAYYNLYIKYLKKNKVITFNNYGKDPLIIKANENTINNLIENQKKLYLIKENRKDLEINITTYMDKVYFKNGLEGEYNALDDSIKYDVDDYTCKKEIEVLEYGERIIYMCDYINE